jgi:hypothetical protein
VVVVLLVAAGATVAERCVCTVVLVVVAGVGVSTTVVHDVSSNVGMIARNPASGIAAAHRQAGSNLFMPINSWKWAAAAVCVLRPQAAETENVRAGLRSQRDR